jgi:2-hydroxy-3-oxopropionate reductase
MVSDGAAARTVLVESGLLDALRPGSVVLEMGTIGPTAVAERASEAVGRGVYLLDAPANGSVYVAEATQLFAVVGGDREAYERATPVLDAMTKGHVLLGPSGAGAAMNVAVNAMIAVTNESLAETLALAERFGIASAPTTCSRAECSRRHCCSTSGARFSTRKGSRLRSPPT